jgi:hypothetical protein
MQSMTRRKWMGAAVGATATSLLHAAPKIPRPAGELVITLPSRSLTKLSDHKGKVLAVELLLTTCPHCQHCSSLLQKLYQEYGAQGFQPLGGAINEGAFADIPRYLAISGAKFPVGVVPREMGYDFLQVQPNGRGGPYFPQLVFIDRAGVIRSQYGGEEDFFLPDKEEANLRSTITSLLAGTAAGGKK